MLSSRHRAPLRALLPAVARAVCPWKADGLSRHSRGMDQALQTSCCLEEPRALPRETPRRNQVGPLKTFTYFTSFSPRWANPLVLWLCCRLVTNAL